MRKFNQFSDPSGISFSLSNLLHYLVGLVPVATLHDALDGLVMLTVDVLKDAVLIL